MVRRIPLVSSGNHNRPVDVGAHLGKVAGKRRIRPVIPEASADSQTDADRPDKGNREGIQIFDRKDDIVGLIGGNALRDQIKIQQVLFGLLQLHHHNVRLRRRSQEVDPIVYGASRGDGGHSRPVAVLIRNRHRFQRIFQRKRRIDLLSRVFAAVIKTRRRRSRLIGLIPDRQDPAASVLTPEHGASVIDSRIRETDHHVSSRQEKRLPLQLRNPACIQRLRIEALPLRAPYEFLREAV